MMNISETIQALITLVESDRRIRELEQRIAQGDEEAKKRLVIARLRAHKLTGDDYDNNLPNELVTLRSYMAMPREERTQERLERAIRNSRFDSGRFKRESRRIDAQVKDALKHLGKINPMIALAYLYVPGVSGFTYVFPFNMGFTARDSSTVRSTELSSLSPHLVFYQNILIPVPLPRGKAGYTTDDVLKLVRKALPDAEVAERKPPEQGRGYVTQGFAITFTGNNALNILGD